MEDDKLISTNDLIQAAMNLPESKKKILLEKIEQMQAQDTTFDCRLENR